jgi:hypothetical protein
MTRLRLAIAGALATLLLAFPLYAALSQTATIGLSVDSVLVNTQDLSNVSDHLTRAYSLPFTSGTGLNQVSNIFHDQRTLAASATEDLDLAGVLTNAMGQTITFTKLKAVIVKAATGNTNNVVVSRPASNGVPLFSASSDAIAVQPNGMFVFVAPSVAGVTVTAATGDLLTFTNSAAGTSVTYDVILIGS